MAFNYLQMRKNRGYFAIDFIGGSYKIGSNVAHMKQPEYKEGPQALENIEKMAIAVFQGSKPEGRKTRKQSSKTASELKP